MQNFFWNLPFQVFIAITSFFIFAWAGIFISRDFHKKKQEENLGVESLWYKRPKIQTGFKCIVYGIALLLFDFGSSAMDLLPHNIAIISALGIFFIAMSIVFVIASSRLLYALRNLQYKSTEDFPLSWYRQPKIMKRIGQILFLCGPLFDIAYIEYSLLSQNILHQPLSENTSFLVITAGLFFLFAVAFYFYAILLEILKSRSY